MELKDRIREAMQSAGLKPLQLANAAGVSSGAVTHWLGGATKSLKADTANRIAQATGYSVEWLTTGTGDKKPSAAPTERRTGLTPGAVELAALYDLIPVSDRVGRATAYNLATTAILEVLQAKPSK
jgi:transcriptional regulator with XRE-family HTH domain